MTSPVFEKGYPSYEAVNRKNLVAKHMEKFNRPATHKDKKKESKIKGYGEERDV